MMSLDRWADGGAGGRFGSGVAAAFFLLPAVSALLFFLCFLCSLCQQRSSLSAAASWRCWWRRPGECLGRWSAFLPLLLCVFLQLCSPLFSFLPSASHGAVVDWEGNDSWRWCWWMWRGIRRCLTVIMKVAVAGKPDDSSGFLLLLPRAEAQVAAFSLMVQQRVGGRWWAEEGWLWRGQCCCVCAPGGVGVAAAGCGRSSSSLLSLLLLSVSVTLFLSKQFFVSLSRFLFFFFSSSAPPFLFSTTSIYKQKERTPLLCPIVVRGGAGLPYLCRVRWLAVYKAWCPFLGRVWLGGYGFWQGFMQVGGRESEREKDF